MDGNNFTPTNYTPVPTVQNNTPTPYMPEGATPYMPEGATPVGNNQQQSQTPTSSAMEKTGAYDIPVLGGLLRGAIQPNTQLIDTTLQKRQQLSNLAKSNPQQAVQMAKDTLGSGNTLQDLMTGKGMARTALPAALTDATIADVPNIAKGAINVVKSIPKIASNLTFKGAANAATKAASKATAEGANATWDDLQYDVRSQVEKQLGNTQEVRDAVNNLLSEKTPAALEGQGANALTKSPTDLLDWRRQITARGGGGGVLANLFKGTNIDSKVSSIARKVISSNLHDIAPGTQTPDKLYSFYKTLGGDVPTWIKRVVAGTIADRTVGKRFGGPIEGLIDIAAGSRF